MARNKYPEETVRKIIEVSGRLFTERGYENTSMQDIIDALGMSKGAIYHHFKSKKELFGATMDAMYEKHCSERDKLLDSAPNALEKIKSIYRYDVGNNEKLSVDDMYIDYLFSDPRLVLENMRINVVEGARELAELIREGNEDGSLHVEYPLETAELMMIITNVWIGYFHGGKDRLPIQVKLCARIMEYLGIPIFDDEIQSLFLKYSGKVFEKAKEKELT